MGFKTKAVAKRLATLQKKRDEGFTIRKGRVCPFCEKDSAHGNFEEQERCAMEHEYATSDGTQWERLHCPICRGCFTNEKSFHSHFRCTKNVEVDSCLLLSYYLYYQCFFFPFSIFRNSKKSFKKDWFFFFFF